MARAADAHLDDNGRQHVQRLGALAEHLDRPPTVAEAQAALGLSRSNAHHYLEIARREHAWTSPSTQRMLQFLAHRTPEQQRRLAGHALAAVLNISHATGEDIIVRITKLQGLGLREAHVLMMLDARRKPDSATAEPIAHPAPRPALIAVQRSKRAARGRTHPAQLALPIEDPT